MYNYPFQNAVPVVDERIWVQNQMAADSYLVAPNGFVRLWDANKPIFYEKRADATGRPLPLEIYEYSKKTPIQADLNDNGGIDYQKEINGLMRRIEALERGLGGNSGAADNYVLASDFATLQRQIDSSTDRLAQQGNQIANGLCDGFYTQAQLINGVNTNILQGTNTLQAQMAQCCCDNREAISNVNYNMASQANGITNAINTGFCNTNYNNSTNTRDIIDAQNAGTRAILDAIQANKVEALNQRIAEQNQQINALQLSASQQAQNSYLISQLAPKMPVASYSVPNPFTGCGCS